MSDTKPPRRLLEGAKAIADFVGLQLQPQHERPGADRRKRVTSWVRIEGFPAFLAAGRWYAYEHEIEQWLRSLRRRTLAKLRPR
jgi:hypothetical protein